MTRGHEILLCYLVINGQTDCHGYFNTYAQNKLVNEKVGTRGFGQPWKVKDKGGCKAYDMIERSMNKVYTGYQEARLLTDPIKNMAKCLTKSNFMLILLLNKFSSCNQLLYESLSSVQRQGRRKRKAGKKPSKLKCSMLVDAYENCSIIQHAMVSLVQMISGSCQSFYHMKSTFVWLLVQRSYKIIEYA